MIQLKLTNEQKAELHEAKKTNLHPTVVRKIDVILLKDEGISHNGICRVMGLCKNTVRKYIRQYLAGGLARLKELNYYAQKSEMEAYTEEIVRYFNDHPVRSTQEAIEAIKEITGLVRSPSQVRQFLKGLGLSYRKVGMIPKRADVEEQETFKNEKLNPRLEEAKAGTRTVFFVDAAHFVFAPFLGFLWSFTRLFVEAPAGRQRFSVLAAIDAITLEIVKITTDGSVNADSMKALLQLIHDLHLKTPITLVLDNARYQHCAAVKACAESLHIELLFLPPYSPNLNLIERLWKFVKKTCLYSKTYDSFDTFCSAISNTLSQTKTTYRDKLTSLLTLNFQSFKAIKESGCIIKL